ncbi:MAG: hypothetical protein ACYC9O_21205, partial [Candidatus Latescibacterota bacterium]
MSDETGGETGAGAETADSEELILNPLKRVALVVFSPQRVFESLRVKSSRLDWIIPLALTMLLTLTVVNIGRTYLLNDQLETVTAQIENKTSLTEEQKTARIEQTKEGMENMAGFTRIMTNVGAVVGGFAALAVIALVMKGITGFMLNSCLAFG